MGSWGNTNELISILECDTLESTLVNVVTVPALPVVHGTTLKLNCPEGYTNLGGNTATCLYGQVVPTKDPPKCTSESIFKTAKTIIIQ